MSVNSILERTGKEAVTSLQKYCSGGTEKNRWKVQSGVDIATSSGRTVEGSCPGKDERFFWSPKRPGRLWGPPSLLFSGHWRFFPGWKRPERKVDHSPPVVRRSRMRVGRPLHPLQPCMAWTGTSLCFSLYRVDVMNQLKPNQELTFETWQLKLVTAVLADTNRYSTY
jgi:hypothetical protein